MGNKKINPLFKLLGIQNIYEEFDSKVSQLGFLKGNVWLIHKLGITYEFDKETNLKGSTIIYSNHPTGLDPYLLTAVMGREDSFFWGDLYQSKKGTNISKHIIPIAPKPFWSILRRPLTNWPGYVYMRLTTPALSKEEARIVNRKSIEKTIELLKKGKQIIIFPSGGEYEFLRPAKGFSVILNICKEQKIKVNVVKLQIKKFTELRLLFHFMFNTKINAYIS